MTRSLAAAALLLLAAPAAGMETLAVVSVADPPGPDADLGELTHQLRAACRDRTGGVLDVPEMRARLLGQTSNATLTELDRAYGGALATYQNGEYESSIRTLYAIVDDLEKIPEGNEAYGQWIRAILRLAHAEATLGHRAEAQAAMERLAAVEPKFQPDPEQYSPTYRKDFDVARARVAARPRRKISVTSVSPPGAVYVDGRPSGTTPVTITVPAGRYRVGGSAGALRVPSVQVDVRDGDGAVILDFGLAEALRVNAGPGLALTAPARPAGVVRAGAWLAVDKVLAASVLADGKVPLFVGTLYDIRRGALLREGRVRMTAGTVPSVNLGALSAFLLTGQQSPLVVNATPQSQPPSLAAALATPAARPPPPPSSAQPAPPVKPVLELAALGGPSPAFSAPPEAARLGATSHSWMRPAAYASGAAALLLAGLAGSQAMAASGAYHGARDMLRSDGTYLPGADPAVYRDRIASGEASTRRAYLAAGGAALMAVAAGVLWYVTREPQPGGPAIHF